MVTDQLSKPVQLLSHDNGFDTLSVRIYHHLLEMIMTGQLHPGQRLVRRTLGKQLGVSAVPVTEALFKLELDGLVETAPRYGARVVLLTEERVLGDYMMREALECQIARLCSKYADEATAKQLMALAVTVDRAMYVTDPKDSTGMQQHLEFHYAVAQAGRVSSLIDELKRGWYRRLMSLAWVNSSIGSGVDRDWHQELVCAMATRDPGTAESKMREHLGHNKNQYMDAAKQLLGLEMTGHQPQSVEKDPFAETSPS